MSETIIQQQPWDGTGVAHVDEGNRAQCPEAAKALRHGTSPANGRAAETEDWTLNGGKTADELRGVANGSLAPRTDLKSNDELTGGWNPEK